MASRKRIRNSGSGQQRPPATSNSVSDYFAGGAYTDSGGDIIGVADGGTVNGTAINLAPLANYGWTNADSDSDFRAARPFVPAPPLIPAGITTTSAAISTATPAMASSTRCVDAGQWSNYALNFTTQPAVAPVATDSRPQLTDSERESIQPVVQFHLRHWHRDTDCGSAATSAGVASYTLQVDTAGVGDTLTANLALTCNRSPPPATPSAWA